MTPAPPPALAPTAARRAPELPRGASAPAAPDVLARARPGWFGAPSPRLELCVAVPARDEAARLPALVAALDAQRDAGRSPFEAGTAEALVLVNNTSDGSAALLRRLARTRPWLRVAEVALGPHEAHVGRARQIAMDAACARLLAVGRPDGLICSTDADTAPAPDWLAATRAETAAGVDAVGGRALLLPAERAALAPGAARLYLLELAYRRAVEELRALYAPEPHDPAPRHHHHFGASLAVRADAYAAVGGLPARERYEDIALVHALWAAGRRVRHSPAVRVRTSARAVGRAQGGLAADVVRWTAAARAGREPLVESAEAAERRLAALGLDRALRPDAPPPVRLLDTPPPPPGGGEPISRAIAGLRERIARLRPLPPEARLARARRVVRAAHLPRSARLAPMPKSQMLPAETPPSARPAPPASAAARAVDAARAFGRAAAARAADADAERAYLAADLADLRASGLLAMTLPEAEGGAGLGAPARLHALLTALRHVGRGSLPLGRLLEGHANALLLVERHGTPAQRARLFADARGGHLFAVWNTETPADGVRLAPGGGAAGGAMMAGAKTFATGCAVVTRPLVTGRWEATGDGAPGGWQMAVVRAGETPFAAEPDAWRAEGMRATGSGVARFDGVRLEPRDLLGPPDRYYAEPDFSGGAVRFLAVQTGGAEALADALVAHLAALGRAGHPAQQARLGQVEAALETARLWLLGVARVWGRADATDAERVAAVQAARGVVESVCLDVMRWADRAAGAHGLGAPGPLERVGRDLRLYLRQPDPDGALAAAGAFAAAHRAPARGSDWLP